jgi:hypothetical protein
MMTTSKILAETAMYKLIVETLKSQATLTGFENVYAVVNKETDVTEGRVANLADALGYMHSIQMAYDNIIKAAAIGAPETPASDLN